MSTKLKAVAVVVALLGMAAVLLIQQRQISQLTAENSALRAEVGQMTSWQETNAVLTEKLKAATESSQSKENELMRLRGQMVRLRQVEQESGVLKTQRQQLDQQVRELRSAAAAQQQQQATPNAKGTGGTPTLINTDLGTLELADRTPASFDLGGGTNCVVTPMALADGNTATEITIGVKNADGTFSELSRSRITARPGQNCSISVGDRMVGLTVKLK